MGNYQETKNKYIKEKVDELKVYVPKGEKEIWKTFAKARNIKSLNALIVEAVREKMEREGN